MNIETRVEIIEGVTYCAYCGKVLDSGTVRMCPSPPIVCTCEDAKRELDLYNQIAELYYKPIHADLVDKKVNIYKHKLLGTYKSPESVYALNSLSSIHSVTATLNECNTNLSNVFGSEE